MTDIIHHIPKQIDESAERFHFYETHWKNVGLDLLSRHAGPLEGLSLLDYGCGRGETLRLASERGMKAFGTDNRAIGMSLAVISLLFLGLLIIAVKVAAPFIHTLF